MYNKINTAIRYEHPEAAMQAAVIEYYLQDQIPRRIILFLLDGNIRSNCPVFKLAQL